MTTTLPLTAKQIANRQHMGVPVKWRGTTGSVKEKWISISLDSLDGSVIRLQMDFVQAAKLQAMLSNYLPAKVGA